MKFQKEHLKYSCFAGLMLNITTSILGIIFYLIPFNIIYGNVFGAIMLISWSWNFGLLYINDRFLIKSDERGRKINHFCYFFLVFYILAMLLMVENGFLLSITISTEILAFLGAYTFIFIGFFGIAACGIVLSILDIKNLNTRGVWKLE